MKQREPVSIICVSNNREVLESCLEKSVKDGLAQAPDTELIVMENSTQRYPTAGAALNEGVSQARHKVCVMVHQDVYLHSLPKLEEAASRLLQDPQLGFAGAIGIEPSGKLQGQIRDRLLLTGDPISGVQDVDSLDEVLVMATRQQLLREPLSQDSELAWHAYAVEYGARQRRAGRRVVATDIPLTHNSLTINLARLSEAHAHVSGLYPEFATITTTCGVVGAPEARRLPGFLESRRWRWRWLRNSLMLRRSGALNQGEDVLLSDVRFSIDAVLDASGTDHLLVLNVSDAQGQADYGTAVQLPRLGRNLTYLAIDRGELGAVAEIEESASVLLTNLNPQDIAKLRTSMAGKPQRQGHDMAIGHWLLAGPAAGTMPEAFNRAPVKPLAFI